MKRISNILKMDINTTVFHAQNLLVRDITLERMTKPKRPLSAYNFFYKIERAKLLGLNIDEVVEEEKSGVNTPIHKRARKHRKTPGMIGFCELAKRVSEKWRSMSKSEREPYQKMFEEDRERYQREMMAWTMCKPSVEIINDGSNDCKEKSIFIDQMIFSRKSEQHQAIPATIPEAFEVHEHGRPNAENVHEVCNYHPYQRPRVSNFARYIHFDLLSPPWEIQKEQHKLEKSHASLTNREISRIKDLFPMYLLESAKSSVMQVPSCNKELLKVQPEYEEIMTRYSSRLHAVHSEDSIPCTENQFQDVLTVISNNFGNNSDNNYNMVHMSETEQEANSQLTPICSVTRSTTNQNNLKQMMLEPDARRTMLSHSMTELEGDLAALLDEDTISCLSAS